MDPLSRSALTEKHGKHDGFPCRAWLVAIVAGKPQTPSVKGVREANAKTCSFPDGPLQESFGMLPTDATV